jgi:hypothetical protein
MTTAAAFKFDKFTYVARGEKISENSWASRNVASVRVALNLAEKLRVPVTSRRSDLTMSEALPSPRFLFPSPPTRTPTSTPLPPPPSDRPPSFAAQQPPIPNHQPRFRETWIQLATGNFETKPTKSLILLLNLVLSAY